MTILSIFWVSASLFFQNPGAVKTELPNFEIVRVQTPTIPLNFKEDAYQILSNKCNVCHVKRNRRRVFTRSNMDAWSVLVYDQVFVKKRMPKKSGEPLSENEYEVLKTWINSLKK